MGKAGKKSQGSHLRPVTKIELSEKNKTRRIVLVAILLAIATVSIGLGVHAMLTTEPGWEIVESVATERNCSNDFIFNYCFGQGELSATVEKKQISTLYAEAATNAYRIFNEEIVQLSEHVNQPVAVDPALYDALAQIQESGNRCLYLAPVYVEYNRVFLCDNDVDAAQYDPNQNADLVEYIVQIAEFANNPAMIDVELLADHQVQLKVSADYLAFAQEYEITEFLDFGWMKNAFVVDYLANELSQAGFTNGFLSSYDGFTRNLDTRGENFSLNLFDRIDSNIYLPAVMQYSKPISIVFLRDYPMSQRDAFHYYPFEDGHIVSVMVDPLDGMCKSSVDSLVSYSYDAGCAEILLQLTPVYLNDNLNVAALNQLKDAGINSIWFEDTVLFCNDSTLHIVLNADSGVEYILEYK